MPLARLAGVGGTRVSGRVRVGAPSAQNHSGWAGAPTLTRLAPFATLSRQAGEGCIASTRRRGRISGAEW